MKFIKLLAWAFFEQNYCHYMRTTAEQRGRIECWICINLILTIFSSIVKFSGGHSRERCWCTINSVTQPTRAEPKQTSTALTLRQRVEKSIKHRSAVLRSEKSGKKCFNWENKSERFDSHLLTVGGGAHACWRVLNAPLICRDIPRHWLACCFISLAKN